MIDVCNFNLFRCTIVLMKINKSVSLASVIVLSYLLTLCNLEQWCLINSQYSVPASYSLAKNGYTGRLGGLNSGSQ